MVMMEGGRRKCPTTCRNGEIVQGNCSGNMSGSPSTYRLWTCLGVQNVTRPFVQSIWHVADVRDRREANNLPSVINVWRRLCISVQLAAMRTRRLFIIVSLCKWALHAGSSPSRSRSQSRLKHVTPTHGLKSTATSQFADNTPTHNSQAEEGTRYTEDYHCRENVEILPDVPVCQSILLLYNNDLYETSVTVTTSSNNNNKKLSYCWDRRALAQFIVSPKYLFTLIGHCAAVLDSVAANLHLLKWQLSVESSSEITMSC